MFIYNECFIVVKVVGMAKKRRISSLGRKKKGISIPSIQPLLGFKHKRCLLNQGSTYERILWGRAWVLLHLHCRFFQHAAVHKQPSGNWKGVGWVKCHLQNITNLGMWCMHADIWAKSVSHYSLQCLCLHKVGDLWGVKWKAKYLQLAHSS